MNFDQIDWKMVAAGWVLFEQIIAGSSMKSNSTMQLVCNIIDSVITAIQKGKTNEKTDSADA